LIEDAPVSVYKKFLMFLTLAVAALAASASTSEAQGYHGHSHVVVVGGYYGYPGYWYSPWYGSPYQWGPYPYPAGYYGWIDASVRLEVTPRDAAVYVDGYYAGTVDDFDGTFQRLRVQPGAHDLEIYKDGFRPLRQKAYLSADNTFRIKQALQPLAPGEQMEPRPQPVNPPAGQPYGQQPQTAPAPRGRSGHRTSPPPPQGGEPRDSQPPDVRVNQPPSGAYGSVSIRVQPADAEVSVDGDVWRSPAGQDHLVIDLAEGSHTVEIRKGGFRTYVTQVDVKRGETAALNVSLRQE
jgi:PEGA domain-containing protein